MWKHIVARALALEPGEEKRFDVTKAAVVQAGNQPVIVYYSVVIRDTDDPDRIYDLAFAPPAFTAPPNTEYPKQYPFLYLYSHLADVMRSETYRHFYPPRFVSDVIQFDTSHTMFATGSAPFVSFVVNTPKDRDLHNAALSIHLFDRSGKSIFTDSVPGPIAGQHRFTLRTVPAGLYTVEVRVESGLVVVASNQIELALNPLPRSILVFCAHEDDETAHPGIIRAAVENQIPIHLVYWTSGDAGGCDRFYMHSCDAARAIDFGEVRMDESRAALGHLGVRAPSLAFLGLPDGGLEQIWDHHIKASDPYLSVLLASDHSPYRDSAIPNLPYARDSAIDAARQFILRFKPDLIVTGHPDERHVDHRTNNWLVIKAMQQLLREGKISGDTEVLVDVSYGAAPRIHAPYRFEKHTFYVSGEVARLGQEATWYYQSQDGNHQQAKIIPFDKLPREEPYPHYRILDWQNHEGWNEAKSPH
jgi:LmbE family N-acetylglucosaminyl deacetylase